MSYYVHDIPGRLRVKSPLIKNNETVAAAVKELLKGVDGVDSVNVNLTTGSCLVSYCPKTTNNCAIIGALQDEGYFDLSRAMTNDQYIEYLTSKALTLVSAFI
jgi:copper chaperone CopZ